MKRFLAVLLIVQSTLAAMAQRVDFDTAIFRTGDDAGWSAPRIDESGWHQVSIKGNDQVGSITEENSVAWYRVHFKLNWNIAPDKMVLLRFGYTDDADEAFLNGKRIGSSPAYDRASVYCAKAADLNLHGDNVLAVRIVNRGGKGGLIEVRNKWHPNAKCIEVVDDPGAYIVDMSQEPQYVKTIIDDVANYKKYSEADKAMGEPAPGDCRVIIYGDSITERWAASRPDFFSTNGFTGRGISGETSAQFLLRFQNDVIELKPSVVVINYGTNDIAENTGIYSEDQTFRNVKAMCNMAKGAGIKVILTSTLPHGCFLWNKAVTDAMPKVRSLNAKVKAYADANGIPFVDYFPAMVSEDGTRMREDLSSDGVHPNAKGYEIMESILVPAVKAGMEADASIADEKVIAVSPDPSSVYLYTPAIVEGFDGRFVVAVDYGGPGTAILDGPKSSFGDYPSGNQIRVLLSDDRGDTWRETSARIPMMHEILFKAGESLYMLGHAGKLMICRSDDNGESWSAPSVLRSDGRWHQSCGAVDIHNGKITLVYEKWISEGHPWPGVGPVLMQASVDDDLTKPESWKFSPMYNPDPDLVAAKDSGIPAFPINLTKVGESAPGILESNVVRVHDPSRPFYDPEDRSVVIMMRASTGFGDIGVMLKGHENEDGSLSISKLQKGGADIFYTYIPGGNLKFHVCYDPETKLYWMVHSQINGRMNERRRLALSYSPDLLRWSLAGIVATGPANNASRHYATMIISGDDICIVSRSGDEHAKNAHDNNLTTFHRVKNFRNLVF